MNPILQKILAVTRLTRRGDLVEATAAIQQALADATPAPRAAEAPRPTAVPTPTVEGPGKGEILEGLVREIDVIPPEELGPAAAAPTVEAPPGVDRPRTGRFSESSFTAAAGTRAFKLFEPAS